MQTNNYSDYVLNSHRMAQILSQYDDPRDAGDEIYSLIMDEIGNETFANKVVDKLLEKEDRHKLAVKLWEHHGVVRDERYWESQERRLIRNQFGHAIVDKLQMQRKMNNQTHKVLFIAAHKVKDGANFNILREKAYRQWETAEQKIQEEYARLSAEAQTARQKSMEKARPIYSDSAPEKTTYSQPFILPKTIDVNRNTTLFKRACSGFAKGDSPESVWAVLKIENIQKCYEPLSESELRQLFKSAEKGHFRRQSDTCAGIKQTFTDQANACRLIAEHCEYIRYVKESKGWCVYDGTRWIFDPPGGLYPFVRQTTEGLYQWAVTLDGDERQKMLREIQALESLNKQKAMIEIAATIPEIIISTSQLDSDQYLLNINGGTLNLRTGGLKIPAADDFISKLASVSYNPSAVCPIWLAFLVKIMGGNQRLINFLQRAIGYSLTGDTSEQCFFILYGSGANGKTTLMNIVRYLLADYAAQAAPDILMAKDRQGGASPELARLPGVRFVATSETEDGQQFAEASLKQMTGQDTITVRHLYKEYFEFRPQFKIFFATNHKPTIKGTDNAIWRRVNLIPFAVTIPPEEQDRNLEQKLMQEMPGILNWAIAGCMAWQKDGLQPPEEVKAAVNEYRKDMDIISQWLDECCVLDPSHLTPQKHLYASYNEWSEENLGWSMKPQKFGRVLNERGFIRVLQPAAAYRGIGILYKE